MKTTCFLLAASLLGFETAFAAGASLGSSKPSKDDKKQEAASPSAEEWSIRSAILIHVADRMKKADGFYEVVDPRTTENVRLGFDKFLPGVETGKKGDVWSMRVDFLSPSGDLYTLDFFVTRKKGSDQYAVVSDRVRAVNSKDVAEAESQKSGKK